MSKNYKHTLLYVGMFLCFLGTVQVAHAAGLPSYQELHALEQKHLYALDKIAPRSIVAVVPMRDNERRALRPGILVAPGYVLTTITAVLGVSEWQVSGSNNEIFNATLVAPTKDPKKERFALLKVDGLDGRVATFDISRIRRTDPVYVWGYNHFTLIVDDSFIQFRENKTNKIPSLVYTDGAVTGLVKDRREETLHSAPTASGNDGGPLVNRYGDIIGMNTTLKYKPEARDILNISETAKAAVEFLRAHGVEPQIR